MITVNNLSFSVGNNRILTDCNTNFNVGEITCIIGVSGCGKTTLIKLLSGTLTASQGSIDYSFLNDNKNHNSDNPKLYPTLTTIFQNYKLLPHLNIIDNLTLFLECNKISIDTTQIESLMAEFKVENLKHKKVYEISSGERQRIALIRALLLNPTYLLLDEITSALDIEAASIVSNSLLKYKALNKSIILITHSINLCKKIADKFIFMDKGFIVEQGNIDILKNPKSERLQQFILNS